jgi:hypothetical protein
MIRRTALASVMCSTEPRTHGAPPANAPAQLEAIGYCYTEVLGLDRHGRAAVGKVEVT